jgi:hypothetical protein
LGTHGCSAAPSLGLRFGVQADRAVRCVSAVSSVAAQVDADMITLLGMSVPIDVKTGRQIRTLVAPSDLQASAHQPHLATGVSSLNRAVRRRHAISLRVGAVRCTLHEIACAP